MVLLTNDQNQRSHVLLPVLLSACAIPISMMFWFINMIYSVFYSDSRNHFEGTLNTWLQFGAFFVFTQ